jgi:Protein of unknown function (DUF1592)/Protein of unknown function (DUF1588)/Protein of unknown function (DUF1595)/Protein of unknown function (DUF1587)/Protein of unknown function (DUF1585)
MRKLRVSPRSLIAALLALVPGCYDGVGGQSGSGDGSADGGSDGSADDGAVDPFCEDEALPGQLTHFVRLTHRQYDNSVRDLLGVDDHPSDAFLGDSSVKGFSNNADQLTVTDRLARDYRRASEQIAAALLADPPRLATLVGCDPGPDADACAQTFIDALGRRVFRRPLLEEEQAAFFAIYQGADGKYDSGTPFEQGAALVVEAFLQSPSFLYRVELSSPPADAELVALDGWEVAARLSYMMWNSTPDDALLAAAEAGELDEPEGIETQARRLLADPRASDPVQDFHAQWLRTDRYPNIQKDPMVFPDYDPTTPASMAAETMEFFRATILEQAGTYADLMTSRTTYVDAKLARIYGLDGSFGETLTEVELDPTERSGFLTQPGFLAVNAYLIETSPIHRGVFIQRQLLCVDIPDPPPGVDTNLPPADDSIKTTRQRVEQHTSPDACAPCHDQINAPGFSFEGYDAVGAIRTVDNGEPIDAAASFADPEAGTIEFSNAVEMIGELAESAAAKRCYLKQWFRYASARVEGSGDSCTLDGLHDSMLDSDYDVQELLVALTQTVSFRYRAAQEAE